MAHVQVSHGVSIVLNLRRSTFTSLDSQEQAPTAAAPFGDGKPLLPLPVFGAKRSVHKSYGKHDVSFAATKKTPCQIVHKTVDYPIKVLDTQFKKAVIKTNEAFVPEKNAKKPRDKYLVNLKRESVKKFLQLEMKYEREIRQNTKMGFLYSY